MGRVQSSVWSTLGLWKGLSGYRVEGWGRQETREVWGKDGG